jgi:hypothetical protein
MQEGAATSAAVEPSVPAASALSGPECELTDEQLSKKLADEAGSALDILSVMFPSSAGTTTKTAAAAAAADLAAEQEGVSSSTQSSSAATGPLSGEDAYRASVWGSVKRYDPSKSDAKDFEVEKVIVPEDETAAEGTDAHDAGSGGGTSAAGGREEVAVAAVPGRFSKVASDVKSVFGYAKKANDAGGNAPGQPQVPTTVAPETTAAAEDDGGGFKFSFLPDEDVDTTKDALHFGDPSMEALLQAGERLLDGEGLEEEVATTNKGTPEDIQMAALELARGLSTKDEILDALCSVGGTFCDLDPDPEQKWSEQRKLLTVDFKTKHKDTVKKIKQYGKAANKKAGQV